MVLQAEGAFCILGELALKTMVLRKQAAMVQKVRNMTLLFPPYMKAGKHSHHPHVEYSEEPQTGISSNSPGCNNRRNHRAIRLATFIKILGNLEKSSLAYQWCWFLVWSTWWDSQTQRLVRKFKKSGFFMLLKENCLKILGLKPPKATRQVPVQKLL